MAAESSLPVWRYPAPLPVGNQAWKSSDDENGTPLLSVPLLDQRITLMLRDGRDHRRQLAAFAKIVDRKAVQGELTLYRQLASTGAFERRQAAVFL